MPAPPCPRDNLPPRAASGGGGRTSYTLLPRRGASVSLLHTTSLATTSPSLIGNYWKDTCNAKPSFNTGSIYYKGPGTWGRSERGSWAVSGESRYTPGPGNNYVDAVARAREKALSGVERCTFGVLGHQEDSHLDRLEKQHRSQPGPADNVTDLGGNRSSTRVVTAAQLNTLRRYIRSVRGVAAKIKSGTSLTAAERKIYDKDGKRLELLKRRYEGLRRRVAAQRHAVEGGPGRIARSISEKNVERFVDMELILREKRQEPGPGYTQSLAVPKVGGGRFSIIPRRLPAYNYKNIKCTPDGAAVLLQRDNSYVDVGPGQFAPTHAPAVNCSERAPAHIPMLNPRSRASNANKPGSTQKLFRNSQLLPTAPHALDSSKVLGDGRGMRAGEADAEERAIIAAHGPEIWWSTAAGMTQRPRPMGAYKGGRQKQNPDPWSSHIQPAFITNRSHVRKDGEPENNAVGVERFLYSVPHAVGKQKDGPKHLPMRTMLRNEHRDKQARRFQRSMERDKVAVANL